jgi:hypothetical protein
MQVTQAVRGSVAASASASEWANAFLAERLRECA